jgi:hypothetical protein
MIAKADRHAVAINREVSNSQNRHLITAEKALPSSLNGLLALWNALPGVEKGRRVVNRGTLIDQLWPAIENLPDPELEPDAKRPSKQDEVIAMLRRPEGATVEEVARATGWQRHTVSRRLLGWAPDLNSRSR